MAKKLKAHLFSTDISIFEIADILNEDVDFTALIYPSNRQRSEKVLTMIDEGRRRGLPIFKHSVGRPLPDDLPEANAGICWFYAQIIVEQDFGRYSHGLLNNHGASIPEYRGFHCGQWSIVEGEDQLGVTWHGITSEVDGGPIWKESKIPIPLDITAWDLRQNMVKEGIQIFPEAWKHFTTHDITPRLPDVKSGKWWRPRTSEDGRIGIDLSDRKVWDIIRASCPPWPRAYVENTNGEPIYVDGISDSKTMNCLSYETSNRGTIYLHVIEGAGK
jgi:methionyl-tRNA formyltransferase